MNISKVNEPLEVATTEVKTQPKIKWVKLTPVFMALISIFAWLQPAYQQTPAYMFAGNIIIIWTLVLVAIIDWLTYKIYLFIILLGAALIGFILIAVTFFGVIVGFVTDKTKDKIDLKNAKSARLTEPNFVQLWPLGFYDSLIGALIAGLAFGLLYCVSRFIYRKAVFGSGDVLLATFIGLTLGFERTIFFIPGVAIISLVYTVLILVLQRNRLTKSQLISYGPFICLSGILCLLFNPNII